MANTPLVIIIPRLTLPITKLPEPIVQVLGVLLASASSPQTKLKDHPAAKSAFTEQNIVNEIKTFIFK